MASNEYATSYTKCNTRYAILNTQYEKVRTKNCPYLKKRTQFQKSQVRRKPSYSRELSSNGHLVTQDKTNPNKPNFPAPQTTHFTQFQRQKMLIIFTTLEVLEISVMTGYYLVPKRHINHRRLT